VRSPCDHRAITVRSPCDHRAEGVLKRYDRMKEIDMSAIRIMEGISLPEVEVSMDIGNTIDISDDFGLLTNQKKLNSPGTRTSPVAEVRGDDIEFVNLEDSGPSINIRPAQSSEPIQLVRDTIPTPPRSIQFETPQPQAQPSGLSGIKNWFSGSNSAAQEPKTEEPTKSAFSWFNNSGSQQADPVIPTRVSEYLTPEQEHAKKTEALNMLERMDKRGIVGNKMTMANTLDEIQAEVERRKDSKALEASIRFQRSMLTTVTNGLEFLNNRFDPLGVKLDGWSEQVNENVEDYDEIFEELYDKYKDKTKVAPEVRLVMSLGLSAAMCHVTNTMFKSRMPGMDDILRNNPDLAKQFAQAAASQAVGPGFANFVGMGMNSRRPSVSPQQPSMPPMGMPMGMGMGGPMGAGFGSAFGSTPSPIPSPREIPTARREMRGPSGVEDILRSLNNAGEQVPDRSVPPPASPILDVEEIQSVRSGFTTETARNAGRSRRKPAQPVGATLTLNV
jgi:hypothetical protein